MIKYYPALIHTDDKPGYGISFPDFLGCISAGDTYEEVFSMGREAIDMHVELMLEDGDEILPPSRIEDIDPEFMEDVDLIIMMAIELPDDQFNP